MPDSDFVMMNPAFFLVNEHEAPDIVEIDGQLCVCFFTDVDLVQTFYRDKYGKGHEHAQLIVMKSRPELLQTLKQW